MNIPTLQELLEAGVHFGHKVSRGNPRMKSFIYGAREGVHIIDLTKSEKYLKEACEYVYTLGKSGGVILYVGVKKQAKPIVKELAGRVNAPYMAHRWIGGFLTNFEEISKNIKKLHELREQKEKGQLSKYTKKEQLLLDRKMKRLGQEFEGVLNMAKLPDAVFVIDAAQEEVAVKEAKKRGIKVVAIADSNCNPDFIDHPIPGNDDAIKAIRILSEAVTSAYEEGVKQAGKDAAKAKQEEEKEVVLEGSGVADDVAAAEEEIEKKVIAESDRKVP